MTSQQNKETQEEKELKEALDQIRMLEEREKGEIKEEKLIETYIKKGQSVYELFSILIHSGSALGGHYYAYIKSFEDNHWYNFNDSSVKQIPEKEV
jgi:ubiquitin carboxyl-terminal hydrolase 47